MADQGTPRSQPTAGPSGPSRTASQSESPSDNAAPRAPTRSVKRPPRPAQIGLPAGQRFVHRLSTECRRPCRVSQLAWVTGRAVAPPGGSVRVPDPVGADACGGRPDRAGRRREPVAAAGRGDEPGSAVLPPARSGQGAGPDDPGLAVLGGRRAGPAGPRCWTRSVWAPTTRPPSRPARSTTCSPRQTGAGRCSDGDPEILVIFDAGYDVNQLAVPAGRPTGPAGGAAAQRPGAVFPRSAARGGRGGAATPARPAVPVRRPEHLAAAHGHHDHRDDPVRHRRSRRCCSWSARPPTAMMLSRGASGAADRSFDREGRTTLESPHVAQRPVSER